MVEVRLAAVKEAQGWSERQLASWWWERGWGQEWFVTTGGQRLQVV